ncbi:MAG TPA: hypothetical protein VFT53_04475 [Candidatus Saccharimonadales bacterium]|nr:hypothetical protein [Candidatus Saccharimonadales bacterium]
MAEAKGKIVSVAWQHPEQKFTALELQGVFTQFQPRTEMRGPFWDRKPEIVRSLGVIAAQNAEYRLRVAEQGGLPAIGYLDPGLNVHAGILPGGSDFDILPSQGPDEGVEYAAARMEVGAGLGMFAIGMIRRDNGLFVPSPTKEVAQVPIDDVQFAYIAKY